MPNFRRRVRPAIAAHVDKVSSQGSLPRRRSVCQIESSALFSQRSIQRQKARALEKVNSLRPRPMEIRFVTPDTPQENSNPTDA
jgi:hypothetical protein